jgi:hypothetical protein
MAITPDDEQILHAIVEDASLSTVVGSLAYLATQGIGLPDWMHDRDRTRIQWSLLEAVREIDRTIKKARGRDDA